MIHSTDKSELKNEDVQERVKCNDKQEPKIDCPIPIGSMVRLMSGSPQMTVVGTQKSNDPSVGIYVRTSWFHGSNVFTGTFPAESLEDAAANICTSCKKGSLTDEDSQWFQYRSNDGSYSLMCYCNKCFELIFLQ